MYITPPASNTNSIRPTILTGIAISNFLSSSSDALIGAKIAK